MCMAAAKQPRGSMQRLRSKSPHRHGGEAHLQQLVGLRYPIRKPRTGICSQISMHGAHRSSASILSEDRCSSSASLPLRGTCNPAPASAYRIGLSYGTGASIASRVSAVGGLSGMGRCAYDTDWKPHLSGHTPTREAITAHTFKMEPNTAM